MKAMVVTISLVITLSLLLLAGGLVNNNNDNNALAGAVCLLFLLVFVALGVFASGAPQSSESGIIIKHLIFRIQGFFYHQPQKGSLPAEGP
jgi:hypothetical protein